MRAAPSLTWAAAAALAGALAGGLVGTLGGCSQAAAPAPDADATLLSCTSLARHATPNGALVNNQWNRASAGAGPWRQCLQQRTRGGVAEYGWFWHWPAKDGLYAYPELLVGRTPWQADASNDPRFPRTVAATQALRVDYDIELRSTGKRNLALEFWFTDAPLPAGALDTRSVKAELMIWSEASPGMVSADDRPEATVEIDGALWRVYLKRNWGDAGGGTGHRWTFITYHAVKPGSAVRYDARKFMQDAIDRGVIAPTDTLAGVELGNEISSGSGSAWVRRFALEVK